MIRSVTALFIAAYASTVCATESKNDPLSHGRYLVQIAGCNDCHTAGYMAREGAVPEAEWLKGSGFGWNGPWGTTYAINLRRYMQNLSEEQWLDRARTVRSRPPMPWFGLQKMSEFDLRSLYRYIRSLRPVGNPAPAYLNATKQPPQPFAVFPPPPPGTK